jgi:organic radical activating enzyme
MRDSLVISEKFYSLQGEGQTMGIPAIFMRLSGCNILCQSDSWVCDTIEVWRKGTKTNFEDVFTEQEVSYLSRGSHLVFTGGEPMLHQKAIFDFMRWFVEKHEFTPTIEVETNGTIMPNYDMMNLVDYWNCSPKLSNSGESYERRFKPLVLKELSRRNVIFKFVIYKREDVLEMLNEYGEHIDLSKVVLMPAGESQEKLEETRLLVVNLCLEFCFKYCDRLHIVIWNQKTGV